ncbi:MAG: SRPBCC family protein [Paracoccaceae bacterium]
MSDLHLEREFDVSPERLFMWLTSPEKLLQWWGPEGVHIAEGNLDFTQTGA